MAYYNTAKVQTLTPNPEWHMPKEKNAASLLAWAIMKYRREYKSDGIAVFDKNWLEPKILEIKKDLEERLGYTVDLKVLGEEYGYRNYLIDVSSKGVVSNVLYVAHYDTVDKDVPRTTTKYDYKTKSYIYDEVDPVTPQKVWKKLKQDNNIVSLQDPLTDPMNSGVGCLGADDGAGLAVMLNLMSLGVLGGYCFTTGEECGGIGAKAVLADARDYLENYTISIEIDRRGTTEIIRSQSAGDCASEKFTDWLCAELNMGHKSSDLGSYTDVSTFAECIRENVNIAAGYINAHTVNEQLDLSYIDELAENLSFVVWDDAPVERTAGDYGRFQYQYGNGYFDYGYDDYAKRTYRKNRSAKLSETELTQLMQVFFYEADFMRKALAEGISDSSDLEDLCSTYFGVSFAEICDAYNIG